MFLVVVVVVVVSSATCVCLSPFLTFLLCANFVKHAWRSATSAPDTAWQGNTGAMRRTRGGGEGQ